MQWKGTGGFPAHLWVVWPHYSWVWVWGEAYWTWAVGEGGFKLHFFGLREFPKFPQLAKFHMDMPATRSRHTPKAPKSKSGAARPPAGLEWCWCHGFNVSCGLTRSDQMRQPHTIRERKCIKSIISAMTHYIHRQSLTLQFLEKQAGLLVDILKKSIYEVDVEDHFNIPRGLQDEGVPVDDVNLETGDDQLHNTTVGSQDNDTFAFDFQIDQFPSPPREPGPSLVSCTCQVFDVGPESEAGPCFWHCNHWLCCWVNQGQWLLGDHRSKLWVRAHSHARHLGTRIRIRGREWLKYSLFYIQLLF